MTIFTRWLTYDIRPLITKPPIKKYAVYLCVFIIDLKTFLTFLILATFCTF